MNNTALNTASSHGENPNSASKAATRPPRLGRYPLIRGEDTDAYENLLLRVAAVLNPGDCLEELWLRDFVNNVWESARLRSMKADLMTALAPDVIVHAMPSLQPEQAQQLTARWVSGDQDAIAEVNKRLELGGLTLNGVMASVLLRRISDFERMDRMIQSLEMRRMVILREVDRHRRTLGQDLRQAKKQIEEVAARGIGQKVAGGRTGT